MAKKKNASAGGGDGIKIVVKNRRARFDYEIEDRLEVGIMLLGSEVKSIRAGNVSIAEAYATFIDEDLYLTNAHISEYPWANQFNHEPRRARRLLLRKKQLGRLSDKVVRDGYTIVPMALYFKKGLVKLEVGVGKGKKRHDKRESLKKKSAQRDIARSLRGE